MLQKILEILRTSDKPVSFDAICLQVAVERSALEAMLNMLVQKGKILQINSQTTDEKGGFSFCKGCQTKSYCAESLEKPVYYALNEAA